MSHTGHWKPKGRWCSQLLLEPRQGFCTAEPGRLGQTADSRLLSVPAPDVFSVRPGVQKGCPAALCSLTSSSPRGVIGDQVLKLTQARLEGRDLVCLCLAYQTQVGMPQFQKSSGWYYYGNNNPLLFLSISNTPRGSHFQLFLLSSDIFIFKL